MQRELLDYLLSLPSDTEMVGKPGPDEASRRVRRALTGARNEQEEWVEVAVARAAALDSGHPLKMLVSDLVSALLKLIS